MTENNMAVPDHDPQAYGKLESTGVLTIERLLPGTPKQIWPYLTAPEKTALWLGRLQADMEPGNQLRITFAHDSLTPFEEHTPEQHKQTDCVEVTGEILEYEPYKKLRFSWCWDEAVSEVCFTLMPQTTNTSLLVITHARLADPEMIISVAAGWHTHMDILLAKLKGETPSPFWEKHERLMTEYQQRLHI